MRRAGGLALAAAALFCRPLAGSEPETTPLVEPGPGLYYVGVYPGGTNGLGSDITPDQVAAFQTAAGKPPAWVYFCHNWFEGAGFPLETASWIRARGSIPYIRLMILSEYGKPGPDPQFTLANIIAGKFDGALAEWMRAAKQFATPLIAEYGTEVNGWWFPWNGMYNTGRGGKAEGVARFREAFRHIVRIARAEGASNIRWVFHIDPWDEPAKRWNRFENYYPGDDWVDWVGVSVYGKQRPRDPYTPTFRYQMDWVYRRLRKLTSKPVVVCEFGTVRNEQQAPWAKAALEDLLANRWPAVIGFSWWNADFENDSLTHLRSNMLIQDNPALQDVFRRYVGGSPRVLGAPLESNATERDERPAAVRQ